MVKVIDSWPACHEFVPLKILREGEPVEFFEAQASSRRSGVEVQYTLHWCKKGTKYLIRIQMSFIKEKCSDGYNQESAGEAQIQSKERCAICNRDMFCSNVNPVILIR
ncbi:hypothetical protein TNCV_3405361 [Trichonephila clavipes]|nr:hypothetical protein TNCV_3405361 [Trichonephila clavipes]